MRYNEVTSTNDLAREWAQAAIGDSVLITASHQTAGRGRRGAGWHDTPGSGALMTFIVHPELAVADAWKLAFIAALAAQDACEKYAGAGVVQIGWPNDLVAGGRKLGGILIETTPLKGNRWAALVGIGINVCALAPELAAQIEVESTSLSEIAPPAGRVDVEGVIGAVSESIEPLLADLTTDAGWARCMREYASRLAVGGPQEGVDATGAIVAGVIEGVDRITGEGLLRTSAGAVVRCRPAQREANGSFAV